MLKPILFKLGSIFEDYDVVRCYGDTQNFGC